MNDEKPAEESVASSRVWSALIALVLLAGVALRVWDRGTQNLWFDEGYTAWVARLPVRDIVRVIRVDTTPPLYYLLLHGWTNLFGDGEMGLRSFSTVASILTLLVAALAARQIMPSRAALVLACTLLAITGMQIEYAQEARLYAFISLLATITLWLILARLRRPAKHHLPTLCLCFVASLYTSNVMLPYLAALSLLWLIWPGQTPICSRLRDQAVVWIITVLLFSPWLPTMAAQTRALQGHFWVDRPGLSDLLNGVAHLTGVQGYQLKLGSAREYGASIATVIFIVMLPLLGVILAPREVRRSILLRLFALATVALAPVLLLFVYSLWKQPIFLDRAFVASTVVLPLLLALAFAALPPAGRWIAAIPLALLLTTQVISTGRWMKDNTKEAWKDMTATVLEWAAQDAQPTAVVFVANEGQLLFDYYTKHQDRPAPKVLELGCPQGFFELNPPRTMQRVTCDADLDGLRQAIGRHRPARVILVQSHWWWNDHERRPFKYLSQTYRLIDQREFPHDCQVYEFEE